MRALVALLVALVVGFLVYHFYFSRTLTPEGGVPTQAISLTGVQNDLLAIAQAERVYQAQNGSYGSMDQLVSTGALTMARNSREGYSYTIETTSSGFTVTARNNSADGLPHPVLAIDQTMQVRRLD